MARKKSRLKAKIQKYTILFLLAGFIWCPLTLKWCLLNPDRAVVYGIKLAMVANKVNKKVSRITTKVIPKPVKKFYNTWVRDAYAFNKEVASSLQPEPKPSLFVRVGTGVLGSIKSLFSILI